jgi:hypothetical protein
MALVIELLIVISLVASEVLDHHETNLGPAERGAIEPRATPLTKPVEAASVIEALFLL